MQFASESTDYQHLIDIWSYAVKPTNRSTALFLVAGALLVLFGYTFKSISEPWGLLFGAILAFCAGLASLEK
jgi:F0F1-type ATP synthase assembly protein I